MKCYKCGKYISDPQVYCPYCGEKIAQTEKKTSDDDLSQKEYCPVEIKPAFPWIKAGIVFYLMSIFSGGGFIAYFVNYQDRNRSMNLQITIISLVLFGWPLLSLIRSHAQRMRRYKLSRTDQEAYKEIVIARKEEYSQCPRCKQWSVTRSLGAFSPKHYYCMDCGYKSYIKP